MTKALICHDLEYFFTKRKKYVLFYYIIMCIFSIIYKENKDFFIISIGLKFDINSFVYILIYLLNLSFFTFVCFDVFFANIEFGVDNLFSRLTKLKYALIKLLSCVSVIIILTGTLFIVIILTYFFSNGNLNQLNNVPYYFLILIFNRIILFILFLSIIGLSLYNIKILIVFTLLIIAILNKNIWLMVQAHLYLNKILLLILYLTIFLVTYFIVLKRTIFKIFERSF